MDIENFVQTFNEYYPFERYILNNPQKFNYLFDDLKISEVFIPSTEIKPVFDSNNTVLYWTEVNDDEIYIKCIGPCGEVRLALCDFADHIQETIINIIIEDMDEYVFESLYVDNEDNEELKEILETQKSLITSKYGVCAIKPNFKITNTLNLLNNHE